MKSHGAWGRPDLRFPAAEVDFDLPMSDIACEV
jgi:hypothetical protein